jgi:hypothetical protein
MAIIKLLEYKVITAFIIYRFPGENLEELVMQKLTSKQRYFILSADWNINFLQVSVKLNKIKYLLVMYNLIHMVVSQTRITESIKLLLNIIIMNKKNGTESSIVLDLGFSEHHTQVLRVNLENPIIKTLRFIKTSLKDSMQEFQY